MTILLSKCRLFSRLFSNSTSWSIFLSLPSNFLRIIPYHGINEKSLRYITKFSIPLTITHVDCTRTINTNSIKNIIQKHDSNSNRTLTNSSTFFSSSLDSKESSTASLVSRDFLSLDELVQLLRSMNALDIAVLRASSASPDNELLNEYHSRLTQNIVCDGPGELAANLLLVAGGRSARHLQAIHNAVIALYKSKRGSRGRWNESRDWSALRGRLVANRQKKVVRGTDWYALALVDVLHEEQRLNAHLHLMTDRVRRHYELETLWACGRLYDDAFQRERRILEALGIREPSAGSSGDSSDASTSRLLDLWAQLDAVNKSPKQS